MRWRASGRGWRRWLSATASRKRVAAPGADAPFRRLGHVRGRNRLDDADGDRLRPDELPEERLGGPQAAGVLAVVGLKLREAVLQGLAQGPGEQLPPAGRRGRGNEPRDQVHRLLPQDAGRLSGNRVAVDPAPGRIGGVAADARRAQGGAVDHRNMVAIALNENGVVRRYFIQIMFRRQPPLRQLILVPPAAGDPLPRRPPPGGVRHRGADLRQGPHPGELELIERQGVAQDVEVGVGEARNHGPAVQVDHARVRPLKGAYRRLVAHRRHPSIGHREAGFRRPAQIACVDSPADEDCGRAHRKIAPCWRNWLLKRDTGNFAGFLSPVPASSRTWPFLGASNATFHMV